MCLGAEWAGVVGTLGGVAIGGIVSHVVEGARFKRERATRIADIRREKLEELYQAIEHQRAAVASGMVHTMSIAGGLPQPEEVKKHDTSKLAMLVGIDLPTAQPALEAMESAFGTHGLRLAALIPRPRSAEALTAALESSNLFQRAAVEFQRVVAEGARATI